jgi:hypothetical protein
MELRDRENRKKLPKKITNPFLCFINDDEIYLEIQKYKTIGNIDA